MCKKMLDLTNIYNIHVLLLSSRIGFQLEPMNIGYGIRTQQVRTSIKLKMESSQDRAQNKTNKGHVKFILYGTNKGQISLTP